MKGKKSAKVLRTIVSRTGFREIAEKPTEAELKKYYADLYYQTGEGLYQSKYNKNELKFFENNNAIRLSVANAYFGNRKNDKTLLDIGCGEGFTMKYFRGHGWQVRGLDYSIAGCKRHNPSLVRHVSQGDIYENIDALIKKGEKFSCATLVNVLEHVIDPIGLLAKVRQLLAPQGLLIIEIPNDFSTLQGALLKEGAIDREFWVRAPDHLNYFNKDSLVKTLESSGFTTYTVTGSFPIDYFLANPDSNYVRNPKKGKNCYRAAVWLTNLESAISLSRTVELYEAYARLGIGRTICGYFINA